jgi:hypothetical protein
MANPTFTLIASNTVGSGGASSVTLSSIPATYTDLKVVVSVRFTGSRTNDALIMYANSDNSTANYTGIIVRGSGAAAISEPNPGYAGAFIGETNGGNTTANTFSNLEIYIPNYTSSNKKSISADIVMENNATTAYATLNASLWQGTAVINALTFFDHNGNNFIANSTFYLYGINNS